MMRCKNMSSKWPNFFCYYTKEILVPRKGRTIGGLLVEGEKRHSVSFEWWRLYNAFDVFRLVS